MCPPGLHASAGGALGRHPAIECGEVEMIDREIWLDIKAIFAFLSIAVPLMFSVSLLITYLLSLFF